MLAQMRSAPTAVRYRDLHAVCVHHFGEPRQHGTSHAVFKTPWIGDPRVNIQNDKGKAKAYQVRQVLKAIARMEGEIT
jgi:hypothetical protein